MSCQKDLWSALYCKCKVCKDSDEKAWEISNEPPPIPEEAKAICNFCSSPCNQPHCPYTKEAK